MKLISIALKYCKKIVSVLLIIIVLLIPNRAFADEYKITDIEKETLIRQAQVIDWDQFKYKIDNQNFVVIDYHTGKYWIVAPMGGKSRGLHSDVEPINKESNDVIESLHGDRDNWKRRPVLIVLNNGEVYIGSSFVIGHAGVDSEPYLKEIEDRGKAYGKGENYDSIKNNGMNGHTCIFVNKCKNHFNGKPNNEHDANIKFLQNEKESRK